MAPSRTIKLVIIGDSGVGKTSLRGQYVNGTFSTNYRATIGADFQSKTVPHPHKPDEEIAVQIWDTAGQERFSSLSSAFFRGADAVLLVFDSTRPATLTSLKHWWSTFSHHAPINSGDERFFPAVIVGTKDDLGRQVGEEEIRALLNELVPSTLEDAALSQDLLISSATPLPSTPTTAYPPDQPDLPSTPSTTTSFFSFRSVSPQSSVIRPGRGSIPIKGARTPRRSQSRSSALVGTMRTGMTVFHTPASSLFEGRSDHGQGATTPNRRNPTTSTATSRANSPTPSEMDGQKVRRMTSLALSMTSDTSTAQTVTPTAPAHRRRSSSLSFSHSTLSTVPSHVSFHPDTLTHTPHTHNTSWNTPEPPPPLTRPRYAFTSASSGLGVQAVFDHIVQRCVRQWEWEEAREGRRMSMRDWDGDRGSTIRVGAGHGGTDRGRQEERGKCC